MGTGEEDGLKRKGREVKTEKELRHNEPSKEYHGEQQGEFEPAQEWHGFSSKGNWSNTPMLQVSALLTKSSLVAGGLLPPPQRLRNFFVLMMY